MAIVHSVSFNATAKFYLFLRWLKTWRLRRSWNYAQLWLSYYWSCLTKQLWHPGVVFSIGIEPTTACNLRCPHCISGLRAFKRPTGTMKIEMFEQLLKKVYKDTWFMLFFFQGEPYINPQFLTMVKKAKEHGLFTMSSTNGHFLDEEKSIATIQSGLDYLIISLDGTNAEEYAYYRRGGDFNKVLQGVKTLVAARKRLKAWNPYIVLQFIVFRHNEKSIEKIKHLAKKLEVDALQIKSAQLLDDEAMAWLPTQKAWRRYEIQQGKLRVKSTLPNRCKRSWFGIEITWDGKVLPCCFDKNAEHVYASVVQGNLHHWLKNTMAQAFRKQLWQNRAAIEICRNCTEGLEIH